jgi:hypothetical protein
MPAKKAAVARRTQSLVANARQLFASMDYNTRLKIFEASGTINDPDRGEQAVRYLCEPVHLAQFDIRVIEGKPRVRWRMH